MLNTLTVSQAKGQLGALLDRAANGDAVFLRRKSRTFRIEPVDVEIEPIPVRAIGYFAVEPGDPMVALANHAATSFEPAG